MQHGSSPKVKKTNSSWSAKDESVLIELRNAKGLLWTSIGVRLGKEPEDCRSHYAELMHTRLLGRKRPVPTKVKCLGPLLPAHYFISEDKTRIRICPTCKTLIAGLPDTAIDIIDSDLSTEEELAELEKDESNEHDRISNEPDNFYNRVTVMLAVRLKKLPKDKKPD
jgi:hypothetical protein